MAIDIIGPFAGVGPVVAWGDDSYGQVSGAPQGNFRAVVPGGGPQSLAIDADGTLVLWGGVKSPNSVVPPVSVLSGLGASEYVAASLAVSHFLAIRTDGSIAHWGHYLAAGVVTVPRDLRAFGVASGANHDVVLLLDGTLMSFPASFPSAPAGRFSKVRATGDYAIALRDDGRLVGWGNSLFSTLTDWKPDGAGHYYIDGPFVDIAAGHVQKPPQTPMIPHVLALRENGTVKGWGANSFNECDGAPAGVVFKTISAGRNFSLGIGDDGRLHHWGNAWAGTGLGVGTPFGVNKTPTGRFMSVSAGGTHAAAVRDTGMLIEAGPDADFVRTWK
jgi:alpha-tubulin suppressor-like RCC1 family protein